MRSLEGNYLKAEGTAALAKVLPQTQIKELKCDAPEMILRL